MARKFVCSYLGRTKVEVSLAKVPQEDRATKGGTLYLYPRSTKVLSQAELDEIEKAEPQVKKKLHIHREVKGETRAEVAAKMKPEERAAARKKRGAELAKARMEEKKDANEVKAKTKADAKAKAKAKAEAAKAGSDKPPK